MNDTKTTDDRICIYNTNIFYYYLLLPLLSSSLLLITTNNTKKLFFTEAKGMKKCHCFPAACALKNDRCNRGISCRRGTHWTCTRSGERVWTMAKVFLLDVEARKGITSLAEGVDDSVDKKIYFPQRKDAERIVHCNGFRHPPLAENWSGCMQG